MVVQEKTTVQKVIFFNPIFNKPKTQWSAQDYSTMISVIGLQILAKHFMVSFNIFLLEFNGYALECKNILFLLI